MKDQLSLATLAALATLAVALGTVATAGCSGADTSSGADTASAVTTDATQSFVGHWTWQAGSTTVVSCPGAADVITDLSKALPGDQPAYFDFSRVDDGHIHEVDVLGCQFDFTIRGDDAVAGKDQSCDKFPDGRGGTLTAISVSATKSTSDGHLLTSSAKDAIANSPCTMTVSGTAVKSAPK